MPASPDSASQHSARSSSHLSRRTVSLLLGSEARWGLLAELVTGEGRMVNDLARRVGLTANATTKHLKLMQELGIVFTKNRLHHLVERFRPSPGVREIDFGHCLVRLDR